MIDSLILGARIADLFFVVPEDPMPLARTLVERYVLFEDCLLVDPDAERMGQWMRRHAGRPCRTYVDLDPSFGDAEAVIVSMMHSGRPAFAYWPTHEVDGDPVRAGYLFTDGGDRIDWHLLSDAAVVPDDSSRAMRLAGVDPSSIDIMQSILTLIAARNAMRT